MKTNIIWSILDAQYEHAGNVLLDILNKVKDQVSLKELIDAGSTWFNDIHLGDVYNGLANPVGIDINFKSQSGHSVNLTVYNPDQNKGSLLTTTCDSPFNDGAIILLNNTLPRLNAFIQSIVQILYIKGLDHKL